MQRLVIVLFASAALVGSTARAHHSSSGYDTNKTITVKGTVTRYEWSNPHVYIYLQQQTDGAKVEWEVEGAPPSILRQLAKVDPAPAVGSKSLEGTWVTLLALPVLEKLDDDPAKLPLTPEGAAALKRFDEKTMHPGAHCVAMPARTGRA